MIELISRKAIGSARAFKASLNKRFLQHDMRRVASIPCGFEPEVKASKEDVEIAGRVSAAFRASYIEPSDLDLWRHIEGKQADLFQLLLSGSNEEIADHLCNMSARSATIGTVQGHIETDQLKLSRAYQQNRALYAYDKLVSMAEAVGALAPENPEQGALGLAYRHAPDDLVHSIEGVIGHPLCAPFPQAGLFAMTTARGPLSERELTACYTAWMVQKWLEPQEIVEIGGGVGRGAYWSLKFGVRQYAIIDLPQANAVQAFWLIKAGIPVSLFGEPDVEAGVTIRPHTDFSDIKPTRLALNQDSLPEINFDAASSYLRWVSMSCKQFLSINHESKPLFAQGLRQLNVHEMAKDVPSLSLRHRTPYWLRKGYVTELYDIV